MKRQPLTFALVSRTPHKQGKPRTKLAKWRLERGASQPGMVRDTGIPMSTYQRIEAGDYERLPYQALYNCALVLQVGIDELIDDRFKRWTVFHSGAEQPPKTPHWQTDKQ